MQTKLCFNILNLKGFLKNAKILSFRYLKPDFPTTAIATRLNTSGMPTASRPDIAAFHVVGRPVAATTGINNGLKNPTTKIMIPILKRHPGGGACSVVSGVSCIIVLLHCGNHPLHEFYSTFASRPFSWNAPFDPTC